MICFLSFVCQFQVSLPRAHLQQWGQEVKHSRVSHTKENWGGTSLPHHWDGWTQPWLQASCRLQVWLVCQSVILSILICLPDISKKVKLSTVKNASEPWPHADGEKIRKLLFCLYKPSSGMHFLQTSSHQSQWQSYDPPRWIPWNQLCWSAHWATVSWTLCCMLPPLISKEVKWKFSLLCCPLPVVIPWRTLRRSAVLRSWSGAKVLWRRAKWAVKMDRCSRGKMSPCMPWSPPTPWRTSRKQWSR